MDPFDRDSGSLDAGDKKLLGDVRTHGFHIVVVSPDAPGHEGHKPSEDTPDWIVQLENKYRWAFSVGLSHNFQHPELAIFGLDDASLGDVISVTGRRVLSGERFAPDTDYHDVIEERPVRVVPVLKDWYAVFLGYAQWFYRSNDFDVVQILWPDQEGRFPMEPGSLARRFQPDLSVYRLP